MPVVEKFFGDEPITLNWKIENFSLNTCTIGSSILSPDFHTEMLGNSKWQLELFPNGSNNMDYIACNIRLKEEGTIRESDKYSFTLSVYVGDVDLVTIHGELSFEDTDDWRCHELVRKDLLPNPLPKDTFSIRCIIQPERVVTKRNESKEFEYLSRDLIGLLENGRHHDLVLVSEDHKRFKVHKCIMSSRWPRLLGAKIMDLGSSINYSNCRPEILVPNTRSNTLMTMIGYVYSGTIDRPNVPRDLFKSAVYLELDSLRENLTSFPKTYWGVTNLNSEHKTVIWHLDDISSWEVKPPSFTRILPVCLLYPSDIILVFSLNTDENGEEAIDIAFRFSSIREDQPILMRCAMSLSVSSSILPTTIKTSEHLFQTNGFWHFPLFFKKCHIPDRKLSLITMEITMCDGPYYGSIVESESDCFTNFKPVRDIAKLSTEMASLDANFPKDCSIKCRDGIECWTYRALLWARWPQLREFLVDETNQIMEMDMHKSELQDILQYIYSGSSEHITENTAKTVLEINGTVPMPRRLLTICRAMLRNQN